MKTFLKVAAASSMLVLACLTMAQTRFTNRPGVQELTGKMTVRPWSEADWIAKGFSAAKAAQNVKNALAMLTPYSPKAVAATGEVILKVTASKKEDAISAGLLGSGLFQFAEPDWKVYPLAKPNDPFFANQWHHVNVKSEKGWNLHTGNAVKIAICDTGVDLTHPDLAPNLLPGYNAVDRKTQAEGGVVQDMQGHGTHVSGCAAAIGNNSKGVAGMGWNFKIIPIKIVVGGEGGAFVSDMMEGARWATANGAKVVNISFGGVMSQSVGVNGTDMKKKGTLLVFAGGNNQENITVDHKDVVIVSGTNRADQYAGWPAYGVGIDVMAPCEGILSSVIGGGYEAWDGTSMASPLVSGALAQIFSYNPKLSAQQVEDLLFKNCTNIGDVNKYGWGLINMEKTMLAVRATLSVSSIVNANAITQQDGAKVSGGLADINLIDGLTYKASSGRVVSGQSVGVEATFVVPNPTKVLSLAPMVTANVTTSRYAPSGTLFLWNWTSGAYDRIGESALPVFGSDTLTRTLTSTSIPKYMNAGGQIKILFRAYSADRRGTGPAESFQLAINRLVVGVDHSS